MSRDFSTIIPTARGYLDSLASGGVSIGTPIDMTVGVRTLPVFIDWQRYGASSTNPNIAVSINMLAGQSGPLLDNIKSMVVDNTFSLYAIYVFFPDTKMTYVCPPNATLQTPVLTNVQNCVVFCEGMATGFTPQTTIHFTNALLAPLVVQNPYTAPANIVFVSNGAVSFAAPPTSAAFNGVNIGASANDRVIAITCVAGAPLGGTAPTITGFTLNGLPVSVAAGAQYAPLGIVDAIFYQSVPSGVSANILIATDIPIEFVAIGIYAIYNAITPSPDSASSAASALGNVALPLSMKQGAVALFSSCSSAGGAFPGVAWTGVTGVNFSADNGLPPLYTRAQGAFITGQNVSNVVPVSANAVNLLCGASWR